jgi:hypothetical protein
VLRATALVVVAILASGQSAGVACLVRCQPPVPATSGCHHESVLLATVIAHERCDDIGAATPALVREDAGRSAGNAPTQHGVLVARHQFEASTAAVRSSHPPELEWPLEKRPLETALRI